MDKPAGAQPCQDQHQRGAQDDQEDAALRATFDLGEGLRLVEAKADEKPPGVCPQGGVADDALHAIEVERIGRARMIHTQPIVVRHLPADEPVVVRVACEDRAVVVRNGERARPSSP